MFSFNHKKATQALNYFAIKSGGNIDTLKAIKLIWLADRLHLRKYGRMITNDEYYAMKLGPVASSTYNIIKKQILPDQYLEYSAKYIIPTDVQHYNFESVHPVNDKVFSKTDLNVLQEVFDKFSNMTKWQLSDYSHLYDEWVRFKDQLELDPEARYPIEIDDFFKETYLGDRVFNQSVEVLECVKEIYKESAAG